MNDICCVGHITLDKIIVPGCVTYLNGGTAYYFSYAINNLGDINYSLVTSLAPKDYGAVEKLKEKGIDVTVFPSKDTVYFENSYGKNFNNRSQRILAKSDPFTLTEVESINAKIVHLGSLLADDFSKDIIKKLSEKTILSVDIQGFLRSAVGEQIHSCDWKDKIELLPYIHILKVNEIEIESLTGYKDIKTAANTLAKWGAKEVVITLGSDGSVIFKDNVFYEIPAYAPLKLIDATGCGDTYSAGYLYMRCKGAKCEDAGKFAAALSTLKLEHFGPFNKSKQDVLNILQSEI